MSLLWPAALGLLVFVPGIVILYFLKLRRNPRVVSSTYLWKRALDPYRVNRPFERFQNQLLLWLQILALLLLIFAAGRPLIETSLGRSNIHIFLVDHSASMSMLEGGGPRLELAKAQVREAIGSKRAGDRMMIIAFSDRTNVACPLTDDSQQLLSALETIRPTNRPTRVQDAWQTALSVARQFDHSDIYIVSDGGFEPLEQLTEAHASVHYVPVGSSSDNVGVVHLQTRRNEEHQTEIYARVMNLRAVQVDALVELYINDRLVDARRVKLPAGQETGVLFQRPPHEEGLAEVRIAERDGLALDNRAWIPLAPAEAVRVLLVGEENLFLRQVFVMNPDVELSTLSSVPDALPEADLVVFNAVAPKQLGRGTFLLFGAEPGDPVESPVITRWDPEHPLTQFVTFSNVHTAKAVAVKHEPWMKPVVWAGGLPLISAGEREDRRLVSIAFNLNDSDWPLRASFPLFMSNLVRWVREEQLGSRARAVLPGEPLQIAVPAGAREGTVITPVGEHRIQVQGRTVAFGETEAPGPYRVRWAGARKDALYAVSLLDPRESNVAVPPAFRLGSTHVAASSPGALVKREIWRWLALGGLIVLLVEWTVYQLIRGK